MALKNKLGITDSAELARFGEIYDFAGKVRKENIAKGNFRFAPVMYLQAALKNIEKCPGRPMKRLLKNMWKSRFF